MSHEDDLRRARGAATDAAEAFERAAHVLRDAGTDAPEALMDSARMACSHATAGIKRAGAAADRARAALEVPAP